MLCKSSRVHNYLCGGLENSTYRLSFSCSTHPITLYEFYFRKKLDYAILAHTSVSIIDTIYGVCNLSSSLLSFLVIRVLNELAV
jgi:hypothetical protein